MRFGASELFGSSRKARLLLTLSSSSWLSVVPRKFVPGVAPLLPPNFQYTLGISASAIVPELRLARIRRRAKINAWLARTYRRTQSNGAVTV